MINSGLLLLLFAFFVFLAGLFAGSETGLYQLSRVRLRLGVEKKKFLYVVLGKVMHDSSGLLLTTLIGTNLSYYITTSTITYMLVARVGPESAEVLAASIAAPVLFVFCELIPKNVFFYRADSLMPYSAPVLLVSHKLFTWCGTVPLLRYISQAVSRLAGLKSASKTVIASAQRHRIRAILQETHDEGILSPVQTEIIDRIVGIPSIHITSVMIPLGKVKMADVRSDRAGLLKHLQASSFTRLPVYEDQTENIIGFVNIYEALSSSEDFSDLRGFVKSIRRLDEDTGVADAIHIMQAEQHKIVLVTRAGRGGQTRPIGIVTMKDLAEELLGELSEW